MSHFQSRLRPSWCCSILLPYNSRKSLHTHWGYRGFYIVLGRPRTQFLANVQIHLLKPTFSDRSPTTRALPLETLGAPANFLSFPVALKGYACTSLEFPFSPSTRRDHPLRSCARSYFVEVQPIWSAHRVTCTTRVRMLRQSTCSFHSMPLLHLIVIRTRAREVWLPMDTPCVACLSHLSGDPGISRSLLPVSTERRPKRIDPNVDPLLLFVTLGSDGEILFGRRTKNPAFWRSSSVVTCATRHHRLHQSDLDELCTLTSHERARSRDVLNATYCKSGDHFNSRETVTEPKLGTHSPF